MRYDRAGDQHYDVASAFIKSMRGSDVDAALHYLARMIVAGEDPRFIARRIVIAAAEDVGMADPSALRTAVAAAQAVALIGMPEARLILAEAVVHVATAPKSNASYLAIDAAIADVRAGKVGAGPGAPAGRALSPAPSGSGTARATGTRTTSRTASRPSSTPQTSSLTRATTTRPTGGTSARSRRAWSGSADPARRRLTRTVGTGGAALDSSGCLPAGDHPGDLSRQHEGRSHTRRRTLRRGMCHDRQES